MISEIDLEGCKVSNFHVGKPLFLPICELDLKVIMSFVFLIGPLQPMSTHQIHGDHTYMRYMSTPKTLTLLMMRLLSPLARFLSWRLLTRNLLLLLLRWLTTFRLGIRASCRGSLALIPLLSYLHN
jgi:hypothetical protein